MPVVFAHNLCKQFGSRSDPTKHLVLSKSKLLDSSFTSVICKMLGLIWIQTVWPYDGILKRIFEKVHIQKKSADKNACIKIQNNMSQAQFQQMTIFQPLSSLRVYYNANCCKL